MQYSKVLLFSVCILFTIENIYFMHLFSSQSPLLQHIRNPIPSDLKQQLEHLERRLEQQRQLLDYTDENQKKLRDSVLTVDKVVGNMNGSSSTTYISYNNKYYASQLKVNHTNSVLILVSSKDANSWGKNRNASSFLKLVKTFDYSFKKLSIAILTSSLIEYETIQEFIRYETDTFAEVTVVFNDAFKIDLGYANRHEAKNQFLRRRNIARYRNYLLYTALRVWHEYVLWIDADVTEIPNYLLKKMVQSNRDIVEPICYQRVGTEKREFDLNAWKGPRIQPKPNEMHLVKQGNFIPRPGPNTKFLSNFNSEGPEYVPLDSVGGTMLLVKAEIHRQGIAFPPIHLVGGEWDYEGYDAVETEGLCYTAKFLGYRCWGMPLDPIYHA